MSLISLALAFVVSAAILWAFLAALVLQRKGYRDRRERISRERRVPADPDQPARSLATRAAVTVRSRGRGS